ncbi:SMP-30/gluconolactonase/LRE family protein [Maribellus comscasis]|uniref:SMP-30/gluconolactonase/LRE family protein n=1 Tax=Maribellus comscasis TaxID=2681766 RepID=A0A6I6JY38_9BACT|nr:SMP-30/gluconolactonase/LRE family protein [Maribellus comscasis]QGY42624.1 SMP-30/gluconolactonase/LRE family protein [Maribellus comscasis]
MMKKFLLLFVFLWNFTLGYTQNNKNDVALIVNNPDLLKIIPNQLEVEILGNNFEWAEGPLWLAEQQKLLFSDIPSNVVYEWTEDGGVKTYLKPAGYTGTKPREGEPGSNGLLLSPNGELVLCQHGDRQIAKMNSDLKNPKPDFIPLANSYKGKKLNSPNDAVFHKNGELYFTDPPYGLELLTDDPKKELDFQGVYKTDKNGNTILLTKELSRPNGIAFSNDCKKLYVANSDPENAIWMVYDVDKNGGLTNGKIFFDVTDQDTAENGNPDGLKVHKNGWIFATGPKGVWIFTPEGKHLGTIVTGEKTANCTFNEDYSVLFLTADDYLLQIKLKTN